MFHAADAPAPVARESFALIVFSHCMDCTRFASLTVSERLASEGFVVAAPDHEGGTLYDKLDMQSVGVSDEFLEVRVSDMRSVLDALLSADSQVVPAGLRGKLDAQRVGAFGHSYGGLTTGRLLQDDPRVKSGAALAIPASADLLFSLFLSHTAQIEALTKPMLYMLGSEDFGIVNTRSRATSARIRARLG